MLKRYMILIPRQNYYGCEGGMSHGYGRIVFESERWPTADDALTYCRAFIVGANQVAERTHNFPWVVDTIHENMNAWPKDPGVDGVHTTAFDVHGNPMDLIIYAMTKKTD